VDTTKPKRKPKNNWKRDLHHMSLEEDGGAQQWIARWTEVKK